MLTKKDYVMIARVIEDSRVQMTNPVVLRPLVTRLCAAFAEDNDNFDEDRFRKACGFRRLSGL